jgi:hypothetical protein
MANRSYLYSTNLDSTTRKKEPTDKILSLGEYNYAIPLAFKILVSQEPKICPSVVWDYEHPIALLGDYEKGKAKLLQFLDEVRSKNIFPENEMIDLIEKTFFFLNREDRKEQFSILECGEIYEMGDDELEEQNKQVFEEIKNIDQQMIEFYSDIEKLNKEMEQLQKGGNAGDEEVKKKLRNLNHKKKNLLGLEGWADVLYFDFEAKS